MNRVSVIVPTKNRAHQLREALASIRAIEGPDLEFELVVVDNGSTDDTEGVAGQFGARLLRTLTPGAAAARNEGLRVASTPYAAFLDDDDVWLAGHVRPHVKLLEDNPNVEAVVGQVVLTDQDLRNPSEPYPADVHESSDLLRSFFVYIPQLGATVIRTRVRDTVGYFDSGYEGDEDWDWHLRLALRHPVAFVAVPCVLFRQRALRATADIRWVRLRNMRRVFVTNVRRAGDRGPGVWDATRTFLKQNGRFYASFVELASAYVEDGDIRAARLAFWRALLSSPPHALAHVFQPEQLRLARSILRGRAGIPTQQALAFHEKPPLRDGTR